MSATMSHRGSSPETQSLGRIRVNVHRDAHARTHSGSSVLTQRSVMVNFLLHWFSRGRQERKIRVLDRVVQSYEEREEEEVPNLWLTARITKFFSESQRPVMPVSLWSQEPIRISGRSMLLQSKALDTSFSKTISHKHLFSYVRQRKLGLHKSNKMSIL